MPEIGSPTSGESGYPCEAITTLTHAGSLVAAGGRERDDVLAVAQREQRELVALEPLLDQHPPAGRAEAVVDERGRHGGVGLGGGRADDDALARGEAVGLDDDVAVGL